MTAAIRKFSLRKLFAVLTLICCILIVFRRLFAGLIPYFQAAAERPDYLRFIIIPIAWLMGFSLSVPPPATTPSLADFAWLYTCTILAIVFNLGVLRLFGYGLVRLFRLLGGQ